jgi:glycosyl hydrolase family 12
MRSVSQTSLLVLVQLGVLAGAVHCSSPDAGSEAPPPFNGPFTGSPAPGAGQPGVPGSATPGAPPVTSTPGGDSNPTMLGGTNGAVNGGSTTPAPGSTTPAPVDPNAPPAVVDPNAPAAPAQPAAAFVERGAWRGFAVPEAVVQGTSITPVDFSAQQAGQPFCLSGSIVAEPAFQGEANIGFTINQAATSDVPGQAAPALTATPTGNGIAYTFSKSVGTILRVQLQPAGDGEPWCYEIPEAGGSGFAPYTAFNTACWDGSGQAYNREPIEAVKFQVPGDDQVATPYGFCVGGFADAQNVGQAPTDVAVPLTPIRGSLSGQFDRAKVLGANGESYIVQNNAWGATSSDGSQVIDFTGNGFQITRQSAGQNGNVPISFPSIFVGGNGYTGSNGSLSTRSDDRMPIRVGSIQSAQTRFAHNAGNGDYNATYDVWFANSNIQGEYETAQAAFLMVWLYKPGNRNAIGFGSNVQTVTVDGRTWRLYVGDRNEASDGTGGNAPVISYVNEGAAILDYQFDLNVFIRDAVARSTAGTLNGARFTNDLFLTDIFAGFEIWGGGTGLRIDQFSAVVR